MAVNGGQAGTKKGPNWGHVTVSTDPNHQSRVSGQKYHFLSLEVSFSFALPLSRQNKPFPQVDSLHAAISEVVAFHSLTLVYHQERNNAAALVYSQAGIRRENQDMHQIVVTVLCRLRPLRPKVRKVAERK